MVLLHSLLAAHHKQVACQETKFLQISRLEKFQTSRVESFAVRTKPCRAICIERNRRCERVRTSPRDVNEACLPLRSKA